MFQMSHETPTIGLGDATPSPLPVYRNEPLIAQQVRETDELRQQAGRV